MSRTYTVIDLLQDEEKALLDRLSIVRNRIARIKRGDVATDIVTVAVSSASVSVAGVKSSGV